MTRSDCISWQWRIKVMREFLNWQQLEAAREKNSCAQSFLSQVDETLQRFDQRLVVEYRRLNAEAIEGISSGCSPLLPADSHQGNEQKNTKDN